MNKKNQDKTADINTIDILTNYGGGEWGFAMSFYLNVTPREHPPELPEVTDTFNNIKVIEYTWLCARIELMASVVVWIDCIGRHKSNYHSHPTITNHADDSLIIITLTGDAMKIS